MASFIFHIMYILVNTLIFVCLIGNKQGKEVKNMHRDWNLIKQVILIIEKTDCSAQINLAGSQKRTG